MRKKTEFAQCPPAFSVERFGKHSVRVSFAENATEITDGDTTHWQADVYEVVTAYTDDLYQRIENGYTAWLQHAKDVDYDIVASEVRAARDKLLAESDKDMVLDRMGLAVPSGSTFTAWLAFLRNLGAALSGAKAAYRQALRDLPEQPGFPYDIQWPEMNQ